jgi:pimeloyl-ACP methyl ester carboxylesterase
MLPPVRRSITRRDFLAAMAIMSAAIGACSLSAGRASAAQLAGGPSGPTARAASQHTGETVHAAESKEENTMLDQMTTVRQDTAIRPFVIDVPDADLEDLRRRLIATRLPSKELVTDPSQGVQLATIQALMRYWATDHDWRMTEARLNALPQFVTTIDGLDVHVIHVRSRHENALPLIVTHGWPGSVVELLGVVGPLTDPTAYGGKAEDAFDLVLPSLPGYAFSSQPAEVGWDPGRIAAAWGVLMNRLGYARYVAQGGDIGAAVTDAMGRLAPAGLLGIHLNFLRTVPPDVLAVATGRAPVPDGISEAERTAYAAFAAVARRGYLAEQGEHPQTIGYPLTDSPAGLAAWILDHDSDSHTKIAHAFLGGQPAGGLTRESVVDNIALYWLTNTAASSARLYWEVARAGMATGGQQPPAMALPATVSVFPDEIYRAPRSWAEKVYPNLIYFNEVDRGGHFAAWEEPELFAQEMRVAFRSLRSRRQQQPIQPYARPARPARRA